MLRSPILQFILVLLFPASKAMSQAIQVRDAHAASAEPAIHRSAQLPEPSLSSAPAGEMSLRGGLFQNRRELTKAYLLRLKTDDLLQNHLLEAGVRIEKPYGQMHQGWEAPYCQLRGHFAGHWLSAASHFAATDHDPLLALRATEVVNGLKQCQELNGGQWIGSIPEKYFTILAEGRSIGPGEVSVDGASVRVPVSKNGFLEINREWKAAHVKVSFAKHITREPLPGDNQRFALLDGPVVLAALCDKEPELAADGALTPQYEHQYVDGREWQSGHYWAHTRPGTIALKPLYEVADENYCVYFTRSP